MVFNKNYDHNTKIMIIIQSSSGINSFYVPCFHIIYDDLAFGHIRYKVLCREFESPNAKSLDGKLCYLA